MDTQQILGIILLIIQFSIIIPLIIELKKTRSSKGISSISQLPTPKGVGLSLTNSKTRIKKPSPILKCRNIKGTLTSPL